MKFAIYNTNCVESVKCQSLTHTHTQRNGIGFKNYKIRSLKMQRCLVLQK